MSLCGLTDKILIRFVFVWLTRKHSPPSPRFLRHARLGNNSSPDLFWGGFWPPQNGRRLFRRLRSSYPSAGCSSAEPASVSLDNSVCAFSCSVTRPICFYERMFLRSLLPPPFPCRFQFAIPSLPDRLGLAFQFV